MPQGCATCCMMCSNKPSLLMQGAHVFWEGPTQGLEGVLQAVALLAVGGDDPHPVAPPQAGLLLLLCLHYLAAQLPEQGCCQVSFPLQQQHAPCICHDPLAVCTCILCFWSAPWATSAVLPFAEPGMVIAMHCKSSDRMSHIMGLC